MTIAQAFIGELQHEAANTRKLFANLPDTLPDFKPHEKSMTFVRLISHVVELPTWVGVTMDFEGLDFAKMDYKPVFHTQKADLLAIFDKNIADAIDCLSRKSDADFMVNWTMRTGDMVHFVLPRGAVMRSMVYNHFVHHRAQITLYMRICGMRVVGMYGPSADEM